MLPSTDPAKLQRYHQPRFDSGVIIGSKTEFGSGFMMSRFPGTPYKKPGFPPANVVQELMADDFDPDL